MNKDEQVLPLILGQTYRTRGGDKVTIKDVDYTYSFPYFGDIVTKEGKHVSVASFNGSGMYKNSGQSQFDIVGLWKYDYNHKPVNLQT